MGDPYVTDLLAVENAIFVVDLMSKTRDGGLDWIRVSPNLFSVTLYEETSPTERDEWVFYVGRNRANDQYLSYVFYISVTVNSTLDLYTDSRQTSFVAQLFQQIELTQTHLNDYRIDRAIDFIACVPTNPSPYVSNITGCGGVTIGGSAVYSVAFSPPVSTGGISVGGAAVVTAAYNTNQIAMQANSVLHASATLLYNQSMMICNSSITATGNELYAGQASMSLGSDLQATAINILNAQLSLEMESDLQAAATVYSSASLSMITDSVVSATGNEIFNANAALDSGSVSLISGNVEYGAQGIFETESVVEASANVVFAGAAAINTDSVLTGTAT